MIELFSEKVKERLEELKEVSEMYKEVIEDIVDEDNMNDENLLAVLDDISTHGCKSGCVPSMIYYDDTVRFYERHKYTINEKLAELLHDTDMSLQELLKGFDKDDPLCLETMNQNLLAWWAYEYVVSDVYTMMDSLEV